MRNTMQEELFVVECGDHALQLSVWEPDDFIITLWEPVQSRRWGRIHWVWEAIKGRETVGECILNQDQAFRLRNALNRFLDIDKVSK